MEEKGQSRTSKCPVAYALDLIGGKWHLHITHILYCYNN